MANHRATIRQAISSARPAPRRAGSGISPGRVASPRPQRGLGGLRVVPPKPAPTQQSAAGGGGGGAPAGRPAGGLTAGASAPPWDAIAGLEDAGSQRKYEDSKTRIDSTRDFRERYYGLGSGYDDAAANPYSQAALLQRQHDNGERGIFNGAGNQLYAGSTLNHLSGNTREYSENLSGLKLAREQEMARWTQEEQEAIHERQREHETEERGSIERAEQREREEAAASSGGGDEGGGGGGGDGGGSGGGGGGGSGGGGGRKKQQPPNRGKGQGDGSIGGRHKAR